MIIQDTLFKNISNVLFVLICPSPTHIPLSVGLMWMDPLCFLQVGGCAQAAGPAEAACEGSIRGNKEEGKGGGSALLCAPQVGARLTVPLLAALLRAEHPGKPVGGASGRALHRHGPRGAAPNVVRGRHESSQGNL